jgi:hypothetical protein
MPSIARKHAAAFQHDRTTGNDTWLTPRFLIEAFDMPNLADVDPCSPPKRPWPTAKRHITRAEDGLAHVWDSNHFYFVNPPYGTACAEWLRRAGDHGNGLTLVFARTETRMFHECVWRHPHTTAVLFFEGRLRFATIEGQEAGSAGAPSVLVAYGLKARDALVTVVGAGRVRGRIVLLDDAQRRVYRLGCAVPAAPVGRAQTSSSTDKRIKPVSADKRKRRQGPS